MKEIIFKVEEFHRGQWQPLKLKSGKQKTVKITEEQAKIMNAQSEYHNLRYVSDEVEAEDDSDNELDALKAEYKEVFGKDPHHKKSAETLKEEIEVEKSKASE